MKNNKNVLKILLRVSRSVSASLEIEEVSSVILKHAREFTKADYSALFLMDDEDRHLVLMGAEGFKAGKVNNLKVLGSWENINRQVLKTKSMISVSDIMKSRHFREARVPFSKEGLPLGSFLAVPLEKNRKVIGTLIVSLHRKRKFGFGDDDKEMLNTLANNVSTALLNAKLYRDLKRLYMRTISSLVHAIDARDKYTRGHSERVSRYSAAIAEEMGIDGMRLANIKLSGIFHDIGKIGVSDAILCKNGFLDENEMRKIREHPMIGSKIVRSIIDAKEVIRGIEEHHERLNGSGYPRGLKGQAISLEGRIVAVADVYDCLTTERPYQKAVSIKEAFMEVAVNAGTLFDPRVVKAFQRSFSGYPHLWHFK